MVSARIPASSHALHNQPIKFVDKHKLGFQVAVEGTGLFPFGLHGGLRAPEFDTLFDALRYYERHH